MLPEAEFLDEIQTKKLWVFLLGIHNHLYSSISDSKLFFFPDPARSGSTTQLSMANKTRNDVLILI